MKYIITIILVLAIGLLVVTKDMDINLPYPRPINITQTILVSTSDTPDGICLGEVKLYQKPNGDPDAITATNVIDCSR